MRRHAGEREAVYMLPTELGEWLKAEPAKATGTPDDAEQADSEEQQKRPTGGVGGPHDAGAPRPHLRALYRTQPWITAGVVVLVAVSAALLWSPTLLKGSGKTERPPITIVAFNLRLSRPDGWTALVAVADGGAGQFGGAPGQPTLVLRPRRVPAGLMLEIARADGTPVTNRPTAPGPFVLLLEPNVPVGVREPFRFDVEWLVPPGRLP